MLTTPRIEIQPVRKSYAEAAEREFSSTPDTWLLAPGPTHFGK